MFSWRPRSTILAALLSFGAASTSVSCSASRPEPLPTPTSAASATSAPAADPCVIARGERARVDALLAAGKLDRTSKVLRRANELCPAEVSATWQVELETLTELGAWDEVRALATRIAAAADAGEQAKGAAERALARAAELDVRFEDSDVAKQAMRSVYKEAAARELGGDTAAARDLYLKAWTLWRPNGQALVQAGLAAKALHEDADAQRLFDRGLAELERAKRSPVTLDTPNGLRSIRGLAWGANGRIAVVHGSALSILSQSTLQEVGHVEPFGDTLLSRFDCALSPDGSLLAGGDTKLRVWNIATGEAIDGISLPFVDRLGIAFSPDTKRLAVSADGAIVLFDLGTKQALAKTTGSVLAWSPDGSVVATAVGERLVLGDPLDLHPVREIPAGAPVRVAAFSLDSARIAWLAEDGTIRLADVATGRVLPPLVTSCGRVASIVFDDAGRLLATCFQSTYRAITQTWDLTTRKSVSEGAIATAYDAVPAPGARLLALRTPSGGLALVDAADGKVLRRAEQHSGAVTSVAVSGDGKLLVAGAAPRVWDLPSGRALTKLAKATTLRFLSDRSVIASVDGSDSIKLTGVGGDATNERIRTTSRAILTLAVSADGAQAATGTENADAQVWSIPSRELVRTIDTKTRGVYALALSRDGAILYTSTRTGRVEEWDASGARVRQLDDATSVDVLRPALALSPTDALLASAGSARTVIWETATASPRASLATREQHLALAFAPDEATIATGSVDGATTLWNTATGEAIASSPGARDWIRALAFTPDGKLLASGADDGTLELFRTAPLERLVTLRTLDDANAAYVFTPDGFIELVGAEPEAAAAFPTCRVATVAFPFSVCRERFEVSGLLAKVLGRDVGYRLP